MPPRPAVPPFEAAANPASRNHDARPAGRGTAMMPDGGQGRRGHHVSHRRDDDWRAAYGDTAWDPTPHRDEPDRIRGLESP